MKSHHWISPRTVAIISILVVLIAIGLHFYMQHDINQFEASLPQTLTAQSDEKLASIPLTAEVSSEPEAASITEALPQTEPLMTEAVVKISQNDEAAAGSAASCSMSGDMMMASEDDGKDEPILYAGLTEEEVQQLIEELSSLSVTNLDEKLGMLEEVLLAKFGPDPEIPHLIGSISTAYTLIEMEKMQTLFKETTQTK